MLEIRDPQTGKIKKAYLYGGLAAGVGVLFLLSRSSGETSGGQTGPLSDLLDQLNQGIIGLGDNGGGTGGGGSGSGSNGGGAGSGSGSGGSSGGGSGSGSGGGSGSGSGSGSGTSGSGGSSSGGGVTATVTKITDAVVGSSYLPAANVAPAITSIGAAVAQPTYVSPYVSAITGIGAALGATEVTNPTPVYTGIQYPGSNPAPTPVYTGVGGTPTKVPTTTTVPKPTTTTTTRTTTTRITSTPTTNTSTTPTYVGKIIPLG